MSSVAINDTPLISVVVPIKNERKNIEACLDGIFRQTVRDQMEVIVIDSGSTDGTLEILAKYPVRVHRIPPEEFNCGETRNLGVRLARGQFVVMTVGDARAEDEHWIAHMLECFEDSRVAAVCGQQMAPQDKDKNPLAWFRPISPPGKRLIAFKNAEEFLALPPEKQLEVTGWDDVTAMYRRSVMLDIPYRRLSYLCDQVWARDAFAKGHALMQNTHARVFHYHHETFKYSFKRTLSTQVDSHRFFNCLTPVPPLLYSTARIFYRIGRERTCNTREKLKWVRNNLATFLGSWTATHLYWLTLKLSGTEGGEKLHRHFCPGLPVAQRFANAPAATSAAARTR